MKSVSDGKRNMWVSIDFKEDTEKIRMEHHKIIQAFCEKHGYNYVVSQILQFKSIDHIFNTQFFFDLIKSPVGSQSIFYAIKYGFTFIIPLQQVEPSGEFLASHMIVRQSGRKNFVSFNKIYGMIEPEGLTYFSNQMIAHPTTVHPDIYGNAFSWNELDPKAQPKQEWGSSILESCVCETPLGFFPVLFVSQPLRFEGCDWGYLCENITKEWKLQTYCPIDMECINVDDSKENISETIRKRQRMSVAERRKTSLVNRLEEEERKRLKKIFSVKNLVWNFVNITESEDKLHDIMANVFQTDEMMKQYVNATKTQFPQLVQGKSMEERANILQRVVESAKKKVPLEIQEQYHSPESQLLMKTIIQNIFTSFLFDYIWPPSYDKNNQTKEMFDDVKLEHIIKLHQFIRAKHLDVDFLDSEEAQCGLEQVIAIFRKMNNHRTPSQKLIHFGNGFKVLQSLMFSLLPPGNTVAADILLPSFIYVIIRANISHLASTLSYLSAFIQYLDNNGEYSYFISNLFGAVSFLLELDQTKLSIEKDLYEDCIMKMEMELSTQNFKFDSRRQNGVAIFDRYKSVKTFNIYDKIELKKQYLALIEENKKLKEELMMMDEKIEKEKKSKYSK